MGRSKPLTGYVFLTREMANELEKLDDTGIKEYLFRIDPDSTASLIEFTEVLHYWREYKKIRVPG